jgi:hypothetical protein
MKLWCLHFHALPVSAWFIGRCFMDVLIGRRSLDYTSGNQILERPSVQKIGSVTRSQERRKLWITRRWAINTFLILINSLVYHRTHSASFNWKKEKIDFQNLSGEVTPCPPICGICRVILNFSCKTIGDSFQLKKHVSSLPGLST